MELHRLRYFVAVAETGSFTRAAQREGVTQPSLSQQILEFEKDLSRRSGQLVRLFDRLGRKAVLTAVGEQLLPHAQAVLAAAAEAERAVRAVGSGGEVRVGAIPTVAPYLLPLVARRFLKAHPGRCKLLEDRTERLLTALLGGELDLGILALPVDDDRLHVEPFLTEPLLVALPSDHPLVKKEALRLKDIAPEPFLLLDDLHCFGDQVFSLCRQAGGFEPRVACKGEQLGTLLGLVAGGVGLTVVPEMAAAGDPSKRRVYRPFAAPAPTRTLCIAWHKQRYRPPPVRAFVDMLKAV